VFFFFFLDSVVCMNKVFEELHGTHTQDTKRERNTQRERTVAGELQQNATQRLRAPHFPLMRRVDHALLSVCCDSVLQTLLNLLPRFVLLSTDNAHAINDFACLLDINAFDRVTHL